MQDFTEKTLSTKKIHTGRIISLREDDVELPNGKKAKREIVEHPGAVVIAAVRRAPQRFVRKYTVKVSF